MVQLISFLLVACEFIWQVKIGYPPTAEQLHWFAIAPAYLFTMRLVSLAMVLSAIFLFSRLLDKKLGKYFWIICLAAPVLSVTWMAYPKDALILSIVSTSFYLIQKYSRNFLLTTAIVAVLILIVNLGIFKERPRIISLLSLSESQKEVTWRFTMEDSLKPHIDLPLPIRRIAYNKYYISLKNSANEAMSFFDSETIFFQEVHPLSQKAITIFFWPEVFLFGLSVYFAAAKKMEINNKIIFSLLFTAFMHFITSDVSVERRLLFVIFPLALLMSRGINYGLSAKNRLTRFMFILIIFLSSYGWVTNYYDRLIRPDYWLDNRPVAYGYSMSLLKNIDLSGKKIIVSDILYDAPLYCSYYLKDCSKLELKNFDFSRESPTQDTIYIGFTRNFLGEGAINNTLQDVGTRVNSIGLNLIGIKHLTDNIASGYGQELIIAMGHP